MSWRFKKINFNWRLVKRYKNQWNWKTFQRLFHSFMIFLFFINKNINSIILRYNIVAFYINHENQFQVIKENYWMKIEIQLMTIHMKRIIQSWFWSSKKMKSMIVVVTIQEMTKLILENNSFLCVVNNIDLLQIFCLMFLSRTIMSNIGWKFTSLIDYYRWHRRMIHEQKDKINRNNYSFI
jgi:hypothetical protein